MTEWSPRSWREKPALQQPVYSSPQQLEGVLGELAALPPLVTPWEVSALKTQLAGAARGESFLLQGGDCAERFADCNAAAITNQLKILLQMSLVLVQGSKRPVIRVGRLAGQYAKPRSEEFEVRDGVALPSYRGDIVNAPAFTAAARAPDPRNLLRAYGRSALTLNFIRAMVKSGFADLHHPEYWDLDWARHSPSAAEYHRVVAAINDSLRFLENVLGVRAGEIERVEFYTSHEGLHLPYEEAQTRRAGPDGCWYNLSTHFPWIGARTCRADGAHVEYFRGIANPIGLKVGSSLAPNDLRALMDVLHPDDEPGRLTLIHRFGCGRIADLLPPLIDAVRASGKTVLWCADPMHGNTRVTAAGVKTRRFSDIMGELEQAFDIHAACGTRLGGVHFELTGDNVTECVGGARGLAEEDLHRAYKSEVDPRLNYEQALELAMLVARKMSNMSVSPPSRLS
ncbi:MAG: 3-deoxy-7-phosphoheptulonate synthase class II [Bryobacteraceae bacterium]|nr:3-deoxy-7-phosphoheptulonate synthase class II [Bryobacteraceae bacterium]